MCFFKQKLALICKWCLQKRSQKEDKLCLLDGENTETSAYLTPKVFQPRQEKGFPLERSVAKIKQFSLNNYTVNCPESILAVWGSMYSKSK